MTVVYPEFAPKVGTQGVHFNPKSEAAVKILAPNRKCIFKSPVRGCRGLTGCMYWISVAMYNSQIAHVIFSCIWNIRASQSFHCNVNSVRRYNICNVTCVRRYNIWWCCASVVLVYCSILLFSRSNSLLQNLMLCLDKFANSNIPNVGF